MAVVLFVISVLLAWCYCWLLAARTVQTELFLSQSSACRLTAHWRFDREIIQLIDLASGFTIRGKKGFPFLSCLLKKVVFLWL